jgi:hypothetical protein
MIAGCLAERTASLSDWDLVPVGGKNEAAASSDNARSNGPTSPMMACEPMHATRLPNPPWNEKLVHRPIEVPLTGIVFLSCSFWLSWYAS